MLTLLYVVLVVISRLTDNSDAIVERINEFLSTSIAGTELFFMGLFIVFMIDLLAKK